MQQIARKKSRIGQNQDKKIIIVEQKKLTPTKIRMIEQTVQTMILCNYNVEKTAKKLRITARGVHRRLSTYPQIRELINEYNLQTVELAKKRIEGNAYNASDKLVKLMDTSQSERMQLDSAIQILDRSGITKPDTNIQVNVLNNLRKDKTEYDL